MVSDLGLGKDFRTAKVRRARRGDALVRENVGENDVPKVQVLFNMNAEVLQGPMATYDRQAE
jgi:hypothetical protein